MIEFINFLARWGHVLFGIVWIGMLYYFNFVQGGYFKAASAEGLADAKAKLAPSALWCSVGAPCSPSLLVCICCTQSQACSTTSSSWDPSWVH